MMTYDVEAVSLYQNCVPGMWEKIEAGATELGFRLSGYDIRDGGYMNLVLVCPEGDAADRCTKLLGALAAVGHDHFECVVRQEGGKSLRIGDRWGGRSGWPQ